MLYDPIDKSVLLRVTSMSPWGDMDVTLSRTLACNLRSWSQAALKLATSGKSRRTTDEMKDESMLMVTAEIWPGGDREKRITIGQITATNESRLAPVSTYAVTICQEAHEAADASGWSQEFTLKGHRRSEGVWPLVHAIIAKANAGLSRQSGHAAADD